MKHIHYKGVKFLSPDTFKDMYEKRFPEKLPILGTPETNKFTLIVLIICLIAVNILSGAHTIPTIVKFYEFDMVWLLYVVGFSGFLAIEGFMFLMMSLDNRNEAAWGTIALAFTAAMASNLYSTFITIDSGSRSIWLTLIALILGVFAPLANLIAGEVVHNFRVSRKEELNTLNKQYNEALGEFTRGWQQQYRSYLTRVGIKDAEDKELILSGIIDMEYAQQEETTEQVNNLDLSDREGELYARLKKDGTFNLTYNEIYDKYLGGKKNPALVAKVKKAFNHQT